MNEDLAQLPLGSVSRVFKIFLFGGFCISVVTFSLYWVGNVVWSDFIHSNPNRTYRETWLTLCAAPLLGIMLVFMNLLFALVVGGIVAAVGYKFLRRMPLWYLLVLLPVCLMAAYQQRLYVNATSGDEIDWGYFMKWAGPYVVTYLLGCWWITRRKIQLYEGS